jgi:hypothetical protein
MMQLLKSGFLSFSDIVSLKRCLKQYRGGVCTCHLSYMDSWDWGGWQLQASSCKKFTRPRLNRKSWAWWCHPSYCENKYEDRPYLKKNQSKKNWWYETVIEHLPSKHEAMSSNNRTKKRKSRKQYQAYRKCSINVC